LGNLVEIEHRAVSEKLPRVEINDRGQVGPHAPFRIAARIIPTLS